MKPGEAVIYTLIVIALLCGIQTVAQKGLPAPCHATYAEDCD